MELHYIAGQNIVFRSGFEGTLDEFKVEDPVDYKIIVNKIKMLCKTAALVEKIKSLHRNILFIIFCLHGF